MRITADYLDIQDQHKTLPIDKLSIEHFSDRVQKLAKDHTIEYYHVLSGSRVCFEPPINPSNERSLARLEKTAMDSVNYILRNTPHWVYFTGEHFRDAVADQRFDNLSDVLIWVSKNLEIVESAENKESEF